MKEHIEFQACRCQTASNHRDFMVLRIDVLGVRLRWGRGEGNERKTGVFWLKCSSVFGEKVQ